MSRIVIYILHALERPLILCATVRYIYIYIYYYYWDCYVHEHSVMLPAHFVFMFFMFFVLSVRVFVCAQTLSAKMSCENEPFTTSENTIFGFAVTFHCYWAHNFANVNEWNWICSASTVQCTPADQIQLDSNLNIDFSFKLFVSIRIRNYKRTFLRCGYVSR